MWHNFVLQTCATFRAKSYKTNTKMSIITDYTEKINKVYNDSTLSKADKRVRVRDILSGFWVNSHETKQRDDESEIERIKLRVWD